MDIRQLRAGNLVTTNGKPAGTTKGGIYKVLDTNSANRLDEFGLVGGATLQILDGEYRTTVGAWLDYLEPIEITEDLLLKIGFIKDHYYFYIGLNKYSIYIYYDGKISKLEIYNNGKILDADVKYLHKLQNLIFDMIDLDLNVDNLISK